MLGKANRIKTKLVLELAGTDFDEMLNSELEVLKDSDVIDIQFKATDDNDGQAWFSAIIIYKEDNTHE